MAHSSFFENRHVWAICASARPAAAADRCLTAWCRAGYRVGVYTDGHRERPSQCDLLVHCDRYPGHANAINSLAVALATRASIFIPIADDLYPCETRSVEDLAADFFGRFPDGFGAMHLAKYDLSRGKSTDHCWFGAEYARRINGGRGLYWPHYFHYADDTEAGLVAEKLGVLWRRPELGQFHDHWSTKQGAQRPPHLAAAGERWAESMALFERRKFAGFPGSDPLLTL